jgi:aerobic-type carbon monoxide dehydrogenase small subunit (CoxS/CutS family)
VIELHVNGVLRRGAAEPRTLLSDFLRHELGLTGTHVGCEHGVCGACTVELDGVAVRSCLTFAVQAEGCDIRTVEGLEWGPLQEAFRRCHALQCGFCTPGILIAATDLLSHGPVERADVVDLLGGHLCRCTGYEPIVQAILEGAAG